MAGLVFLATFACTWLPGLHADEVEITLLSINDFHGALVHGGVDPSTGRPWGGAVALAARIDEQRALHPERTFLFDAGDEMQGTPESNLLFGRSTIEVLNRLGVDAAALGNHEFDWGVDTLLARMQEMRFPMLAANVFERDSGARPSWARPTTMLERDGVRVGVIGLITPDTPRVTMPLNVTHLEFGVPERDVDALARELRAAGADVVVLVCHLGGSQLEDGTIVGPVAALADRVEGVDAILAGHTHTSVAGHVGNVPIVIASSRGRALGRVLLFWDGARVTRSETRILPVYADSVDARGDDALQAYVDSVRSVVEPVVSRVIAETPERLTRDTLAHVVADAMRDAVDADVSLTNIGGIRSELPAGPITEGELFEIVPFENTLVLATLTGRQLRDWVGTNALAARVSGLRGRIVAATDGNLQLELSTDGGALDERHEYRVVTNNFIAHGGDGFVGFLFGGDITWTKIEVRAALRQWIATRAAADALRSATAPRLVDARQP